MIEAGREKKEKMRRHFYGSFCRITGQEESERKGSRVTPGFKPRDLGK